MASPATHRRPAWWHRRGPSVAVFAGVLVAMVLASLLLWTSVADVLPDVGKDQQGEDPWEDPVGVEPLGEFLIVRIPDCAAAPIVRIELWDEDSTPYWEVSGPATPLGSFAIGAVPEGFTEETAYEEPPPGAVLRLMVVRSVKGVAGVRFSETDLRRAYVASGPPLRRYLVDDFVTGDVCGGDAAADADGDGVADDPATESTDPTAGGT